MRRLSLLRRALLVAVAVVGAALALVGCGASTAPVASQAPDGAVHVSANNLVFEQQSVTAPAGEGFEIYFENREHIPHNVHVVAADGSSIMRGEIFSGPDARLHEVPALDAGSYKLLCDLHPDMTAELVAQP